MANPTIGTVPIFDPDRGFRVWNISEIYDGPDKSGQYVPNVGDGVLDWGQGLLRVTDVDITTGISTLIAWIFPGISGVTTEDTLLGVGPGRSSETFRLYIDTSVIPHRMCCDSRLHVYGSANTHYKVFYGTNITVGAEVVSAYYNQSGDYVSENIPVELVLRNDATNTSVKAPAIGYINRPLPDGTPVTVVVYNDQGGPSSINVLLVKNTAFIRASEASQRYITQIALESPFLSVTDTDLVQVPVNLPIESVVTTARISYSDGSSRRANIDGSKIKMFGTDNYISTILGQRAPLVLSYSLGPNEFSVDSQGGETKHISRKYYAQSIAAVGAYSMKLYVVPKWIDSQTGWQLDYYLYNLDRSEMFFATPFVQPSINSALFDTTLIGSTQWITVAIDVDQVDPRLAAYRHVQTFSIAILKDGLSQDTAWQIQYSPGQQPRYGVDLKATTISTGPGSWTIDIANGYTGLSDWLDAVYYGVQPLFDPQSETRAPQPTHFVLNVNGQRTQYPIASWNSVLSSATGGVAGRSLMLEWRRVVGQDALELGLSPLRIVPQV